MNQLAELLRQLLYHIARLGRPGGVTTATVLAATGFNLFGPGRSMFDQLAHPLTLMASVVGWTVIFNIGLTHFNDVLERLLKEGDDTEKETKRTVNLFRAFLGGSRKKDDEPPSDVSDTRNSDSKNADDTNNDDTK
jgi:hypothetical protein